MINFIVKKQKLMALPGTIKFAFNRYSNRYIFDGVDRLEEIKSGYGTDIHISHSELKEKKEDFNNLVDKLYNEQDELPF